MPRQIEAYKKNFDIEEASRQPFGSHLVMIAIIIILFVGCVSKDSMEIMTNQHQTQIQQSKLCMAEYSQNNCDALKLTEKCTQLLNCIQLKEIGLLSVAKNFLAVLSQEIY